MPRPRGFSVAVAVACLILICGGVSGEDIVAFEYFTSNTANSESGSRFGNIFTVPATAAGWKPLNVSWLLQAASTTHSCGTGGVGCAFYIRVYAGTAGGTSSSPPRLSGSPLATISVSGFKTSTTPTIREFALPAETSYFSAGNYIVAVEALNMTSTADNLSGMGLSGIRSSLTTFPTWQAKAWTYMGFLRSSLSAGSVTNTYFGTNTNVAINSKLTASLATTRAVASTSPHQPATAQLAADQPTAAQPAAAITAAPATTKPFPLLKSPTTAQPSCSAAAAQPSATQPAPTATKRRAGSFQGLKRAVTAQAQMASAVQSGTFERRMAAAGGARAARYVPTANGKPACIVGVTCSKHHPPPPPPRPRPPPPLRTACTTKFYSLPRTTFHGRSYLLARSTNATARTATAAAYCQLRLPGSTLGARRGFTLPLQFASKASKFKTYDALTSTVCIGLRCKAFSVIECVPSGKRRARYDPVTNNLGCQNKGTGNVVSLGAVRATSTRDQTAGGAAMAART
ncbi:titin-like isoform X4 [Micractinium conductrix]|uniref:Titin-like isoform X4 n=1 Tax=Micractinium conductrix TaxID=554055 RepID=A0A2P6VSG8_9CHLO|nr:titin-like isoform X4 [Micractinium conductrix]|eukprot:PSC77029.1 titin-like isoform X4 [Micractinium conductrix]